jgi:outer membrane autotransporter protein
VADVVAAPAGCFEPGRVSLWADVSGSWNKQDGDKNAPGYDEDQYSFMVGADYAFDESFYMGIAVGYLDSDMDFKWFGNKIDYDGLQLALYGGYDDTENYIRGILSYGTYDGNSHRYVSVEPSNPIDPSGSPDSDVFSFYGELGHRFGMGGETQLTPFAGLSLAQGEIDSFTEKDPEGTGAALHVHSSDGNSVASLLGLRLGGDWMFGSGVFTPDISIAWMHEFDDTTQTVKSSFADAPPGSDFKVVSAKTARDSAVVNVGGTFGLTEGVDFSIIYDGRYSSDYSSSALIGRLGYKF